MKTRCRRSTEPAREREPRLRLGVCADLPSGRADRVGNTTWDQPLSGQKNTFPELAGDKRIKRDVLALPFIAIFARDEVPELCPYPQTQTTVIAKGYRVSASMSVFPQTLRVNVNVDMTACLLGIVNLIEISTCMEP